MFSESSSIQVHIRVARHAEFPLDARLWSRMNPTTAAALAALIRPNKVFVCSEHSIHSNATLEWGLGSISRNGAGARAIHRWFELWRERGTHRLVSSTLSPEPLSGQSWRNFSLNHLLHSRPLATAGSFQKLSRCSGKPKFVEVFRNKQQSVPSGARTLPL